MSGADVTQRFAATFVDELVAGGLREVCIAPGSRSAPLAMAFAREPRLRTLVHIDERCAAFFALGLAQATGRVVAVLCTSGTAAAELHAAVVEAHHGRVPLLALTADRPPELRDSGAPQTIDQLRIYGTATRWSFDPGPPADLPDVARVWRRLAARAMATALGGAGQPAGPVHLNLPFREPLVPPPAAAPAIATTAAPPPSVMVASAGAAPPPPVVRDLAATLRVSSRPMIVAGGMPAGGGRSRAGEALAEAVDALAEATGAVVLAEPTSQLRRPGVGGLAIAYDALLRIPEFAAAHHPDLVIRLGAPPTSRSLNQHLAAAHPARFALIDPDGGWLDPDALATDVIRADPLATLDAMVSEIRGQAAAARDGRTPPPALRGETADAAQARAGTAAARARAAWRQSWSDADAGAGAAITSALAAAPLFEAHAVRALATALPPGAQVVVGSSMAIRDVDTFWPASGARLLANRGANGIDGFVSTGLGVAAAGAGPVAVLCGDLTLYHDMNGLWAARRHGLSPVFVVLDNNGGGIFSFLPQAEHPDVFEEVFGTPLGLDLEKVAALYDLHHQLVDRAEDVEPAIRAAFASGRAAMVQVRFGRAGSVGAHRDCWGAVAEALGG
ncbi:MAG TPA: 2-succinyl-5-enolpyruvyl-6-hydroxy-3-cyclohexene-1-carboxylic-acid synthase [Candidatus Dormibacteraeota bacterium]|jgi:2-succinyl-5-enolpyruvyl-6-hydroxy-3-cyclohexene-1-carboxylate synthase|nr:2-succinyl-5-enolpyruvyl-6-hydroxy-3-cyclohexene-1-carboxylic-acid synthase [Candidatus Dormibacteraeota bacterium]